VTQAETWRSSPRGDASLARTEDVGRALPASLEETTRLARGYFEAARAENTVSAYDSDLRDFATWCRVEAGGLLTLPAAPETVALYITDLAAGRGLKASTIRRRLAAISQLHKEAGHPSPAAHEHVKDVLKGIARRHGSLQEGADPILIGTCGGCSGRWSARMGRRQRGTGRSSCSGWRGAFAGASSRRFWWRLSFVEEGVVVLIRHSKTDQEGKGMKVGVPYGSHPETCLVRNLKAWLAVLGREEGPLFCQVDRHGNLKGGGLSGQAMTRMIRKRAKAAGLDGKRYSAHSLRAGLVTGASAAGVSDKRIMDQTGHRSLPMVHRYAREAELFKNNPAAYLGF
jgi:hypothetical protein